MTKLFFKDIPVIGIDINLTSARAMVADPKKWQVSAYGAIDLDPAQLQEALNSDKSNYLTAQLKRLLHENMRGELPGNHVAIGIPAQRTFSRMFTVPNSALKSLGEAVQVEAEQSIPIPVGSLYLDYEVITKGSETSTVLMSAAPISLVDNCLRAVRDNGFLPVIIEPSMHSIARILKSTEEGHLPTIIIDIGAAATDIAVLDGTIRVTGGTGVGSNSFTLAISRKLEVPLEKAHQLKVLNGLSAGPRQEKITKALTPILQKILNETRKIVRYYSERIDEDHKIEQVIVVGNGSNVPGLGEYLTNELIMPTRIASPWQEFNFGKLTPPDRQLRARYIAAAGLAAISSKEAL